MRGEGHSQNKTGASLWRNGRALQRAGNLHPRKTAL